MPRRRASRGMRPPARSPTIERHGGERQVPSRSQTLQPHRVLLGRQDDAPRPRFARPSAMRSTSRLREPVVIAETHRRRRRASRRIARSEKKRSGCAMPATAKTRDCAGTTTESRALDDRARRAERARHAETRSASRRARARSDRRPRVAGSDERGIGDRAGASSGSRSRPAGSG